MSDELVLYSNPMSRGRIVRWMHEEVGEPYRVEMVAYGPAMKSPAFLAVNPMGKVPALRHGGTVVTETAAICTYLADAFPGAGLAPPPGDPRRGTWYRWLFFGAGPIEAAATNHAFGLVLPEGGAGRAGYGSLDAVVATLELALTPGPYLVGESFTAADVYVGSQIAWGMAAGTIPRRSTFEAYRSRIEGRPAAVRARAADDALATTPSVG